MQYQKLRNTILEKLEKELSPELFYHSARHTRDVMSVCEASATRESLSSEDTTLLLSAAVLHDAGFLHSRKEHEAEGVKMAKELLPQLGYNDSQIDKISKMILSTKIPQNPTTVLEAIICDADLDYLGREDFYTIGATLFEELKAQSVIQTEKQWDAIQIKFLSSHTYHTSWSVLHRDPIKKKYLEELIEKWES